MMRLFVILISTMFLFACSREQNAPSLDPKQATLSTGIQFTRALVEMRFADAHALLGQELKARYTVDSLGYEYLNFIAEIAPVKTVNEGEAHFMGDWPDRRPGDYGWVFIWIAGDEDPEMVSVLVSEENGAARVGRIEWGRPD